MMRNDCYSRDMYIGKHARKFPVPNVGWRYQTRVLIRGYPPAQPIRTPQVDTMKPNHEPSWKELGQMLAKKIRSCLPEQDTIQGMKRQPNYNRY